MHARAGGARAGGPLHPSGQRRSPPRSHAFEMATLLGLRLLGGFDLAWFAGLFDVRVGRFGGDVEVGGEREVGVLQVRQGLRLDGVQRVVQWSGGRSADDVGVRVHVGA